MVRLQFALENMMVAKEGKNSAFFHTIWNLDLWGTRAYSKASNNRTFSYVLWQIKISPSHMLIIQIDTKSHEFNNVKLSFFASHMKWSFHRCCTSIIRYSRIVVERASQKS